MTARITESKVVYAGHVKLTKNQITDGESTFMREIVDQGDAVAVLPYDPERKVAMLVRLLRPPALLRGHHGQLLEAPAGMIDAGEEPAETARRELLEETGIALTGLDHVATVWSTPGVCAERVTLFLAPYSPADRKAKGGGRVEENENITLVEMPLPELVESDRILDMKTLTLILELRLRHPELFDMSGG